MEYRNAATNMGGLLSTTGGAVFGSQNQSFFALDANTDRELRRVSTGGRTVAAPITFLSRAGRWLRSRRAMIFLLSLSDSGRDLPKTSVQPVSNASNDSLDKCADSCFCVWPARCRAR
jgi:hypothetical protein